MRGGAFALIIHNPGDNHALRALVYLVGTPAGSPGALRAPAGAARGPGGGQNYPPRVTVGI